MGQKQSAAHQRAVILVNSGFDHISRIGFFKNVPVKEEKDYEKSGLPEHVIKSLKYEGANDALLQLQSLNARGEVKACLFLVTTSKQQQNDQDYLLSNQATIASVKKIVEAATNMPALFGDILKKIPVLVIGLNSHGGEECTEDELNASLSFMNGKVTSWMYAKDMESGLKWLHERIPSACCADFSEKTPWIALQYQ